MELIAAPISAGQTPDWMKTDEVAARMGCTRRTVRNRLQRGTIPVRWTLIERTIHVNRAQFLAWLEGEDVEASLMKAA
jgi:excisionase family DNA binding protein